MARQDLSTFWLYRYRYVIGYSIIGILLAALLVFAGLYVPGGLSEFEKNSFILSASLSLQDPMSFLMVNLPYRVFQAGILNVFGVSDFTIKLPSLIIGLLSAIGLIVLLRRWFPPSIAVLASLIAIATGQFLLISQSGTPAILYIFWPLALLVLGTQVTRASKARFLWKTLFTVALALSLYTPFSIYVVFAIIFTILLHPHLRIAIRRIPRLRLVAVIALASVILLPLIWTIVRDPSVALTLVGWPETAPNILENIKLLATQYFVFWQPSATTILTPIFGLGSALLIALGLYRMILTRETTRSYLIISWIVCLTPVIIINPQFTPIIFLPAVLLLAAGLTSLIKYWYRLFPLNPYARIAGLLPIIVLVGALISSGVDRYVSGYHYAPTIAKNYSRDLSLLPQDTKTLLVQEDERAFFEAVASYRDELNVVTTAPKSQEFTATKLGRAAVKDTTVQVTSIRSNAFREEADRFYLYKPIPENV